MSKNDKRADEIIEETMRELYGGLQNSKVHDPIDEEEFEEEDGYIEFEDEDAGKAKKRYEEDAYEDEPDYEDYEDEEDEVES